ncbi:hypothetical protein UP10_36735 [Bradyrhizobium sp. LTSPM299]|nr:hypothetical protein UP10_36735 [Bradyrhizobium sp. LTSPM299]
MAGRTIEIVRRSDLAYLAQVHHNNPVADSPDDAEIVRNKQHGQIVSKFRIFEEVQHLRLYGYVQGRNGFVANENLRPENK